MFFKSKRYKVLLTGANPLRRVESVKAIRTYLRYANHYPGLKETIELLKAGNTDNPKVVPGFESVLYTEVKKLQLLAFESGFEVKAVRVYD